MSLSSTNDVMLLEGAEVESISWGAVIAGAIAAFAVTIALAALGAGMGLSAVSPWQQAGVTAATFATASAIWLVIMQWLSSAMGGYLAGRLRRRAVTTHEDETYFRDTAHGFLAWAVSTLVVAVLVGSSLGTLISGGASAVKSAVGGITSAATTAGAQSTGSSLPTSYYVDMLFRPGQNAASNAATPQDPASFGNIQAEATGILTTGLATGNLSPADKTQLTHLIAVRTGMSDADAQHRVDEVVTDVNAAKVKLQQAADAARKAGLTFAIMTALSLAIGAFIASAAGALGGRLRDEA